MALPTTTEVSDPNTGNRSAAGSRCQSVSAFSAALAQNDTVERVSLVFFSAADCDLFIANQQF